MSDERVFLTADEAIAMLPDGDDIHTFRNPNGMIIGADWRRDTLIAAIRSVHEIELAGETATRMNHGLAIHDEHGLLFIATKEVP